MAFVSEITAQLKGDNADFRSKMAEAGEAVEGFDKKVKKFGLGFGGVALLATAFRSIVDHARDLEGPLDANQKRAKEFAEGLDAAKKAALDVGVSVLGAVNGLGEWIGKQVAIVKYGEQQVALTERIAAQTEETLAAIEKDRKRTEEIAALRKQIADVQKRAADESFKQLTVDEQILQTNIKIQAAKDAIAQAGEDRVERAKAELVLEQERATMVKLVGEQQKEINREQMEAEKEAAKERQQEIDEHIKDQDKLAKLKEQWAEEEDDRLTDRIIKEREAREAAASDLGLQIRLLEEQGTSSEQIVATLKSRGFEEEKIRALLTDQTQEMKKQERVRFSTSGGSDQDLSSSLLESKILTLQRSIDARQRELREAPRWGSGVASGNPYDPLLGMEQNQLAAAQSELSKRTQFGRLLSTFGEGGVSRMFSANASEFERLLKFVTEQPDTKRAADGIAELNDRLAASKLFPKRR